MAGRKLTFVPACPLQVGETVAAGLDAGCAQTPGIQKNNSQIHQRSEEQGGPWSLEGLKLTVGGPGATYFLYRRP